MTETTNNDTILKLRVEDVEDLSVVAMLLQDALVPVVDMAFLPSPSTNTHQFALIASRFCWEKSCQNIDKTHSAARRHTAFVIGNVKSVQYKGIDREDKNLILSLLTIFADNEKNISLFFAGDGVVKIEIDCLSCVLQDMAEPWPTKFVPSHKIA
ncbi:MAG: DUF2948 family protein [Alphaproteobacteria bacterium]|nr:MAG: DUF2948 family protein [Alphaproteobacteria bacterium]